MGVVHPENAKTTKFPSELMASRMLLTIILVMASVLPVQLQLANEASVRLNQGLVVGVSAKDLR